MPRKFKLDRAWRSEKANNIVGLLPSEKNVLHRLVYRGGDRGFCFASYQRLATDTGLDRRTVQRTFQSLKRKMLIRTKQLKRPNGNLGPNACAITLAVEDRVYGHGVPNQGDTESGLKIKARHTQTDTVSWNMSFLIYLEASLSGRRTRSCSVFMKLRSGCKAKMAFSGIRRRQIVCFLQPRRFAPSFFKTRKSLRVGRL